MAGKLFFISSYNFIQSPHHIEYPKMAQMSICLNGIRIIEEGDILKNEILRYQRIRDLREDKDLSQKDIAQYLNIKQNTYSRYETNERNMSLEIIGKLADYYHTSVDYLMGRTDNSVPYKSKHIK